MSAIAVRPESTVTLEGSMLPRLLGPMQSDPLCHEQSAQYRQLMGRGIGPSLDVLRQNSAPYLLNEAAVSMNESLEAAGVTFRRSLGLQKALRGITEALTPGVDSPPTKGILELLKASLSTERHPRGEFNHLSDSLSEGNTLLDGLERAIQYASTVALSAKALDILQGMELKVAEELKYGVHELSDFRKDFFRHSTSSAHGIYARVAKIDAELNADSDKKPTHPVKSFAPVVYLSGDEARSLQEIYRVEIEPLTQVTTPRSHPTLGVTRGIINGKTTILPKYSECSWDSIKDDAILLIKAAGEISLYLDKNIPHLEDPTIVWGATLTKAHREFCWGLAALREELVDIVDSIRYARFLCNQEIKIDPDRLK